jgi:hypothetical protein
VREAITLEVEAGGIGFRLIVAATCAQAERLRATARPLEVVVCQCALARLVLGEATHDELVHVGRGRWLFSGAGGDVAVH